MVNTVNEKNTNNNLIAFIVIFPIVINILAFVLYIAGVNKTFYPFWLILLLLVDIFLLPIIDLILLSSDGVEYNSCLNATIFCFPLYAYFREKETDNNKLIFVLSIISYVISTFLFMMYMMSENLSLGVFIIYILCLFGGLSLLMNLILSKNEKEEIIYYTYLLNTVGLMVFVVLVYMLRFVSPTLLGYTFP